MDSNYMFLCGVMWCKFGQQEGQPRSAKGCEFWKSGHKRTGLGDVGKRCASLARLGKTGATQFCHARWAPKHGQRVACVVERIGQLFAIFRL